MHNRCPFCDEFYSNNSSQFYLSVGSEIDCRNRILMESPNWCVFPTLGCLTVGYVLLVAKKHYSSLANMKPEFIAEMLLLKTRVEKVISERLGTKCLTFEHGTTSPSASGANSVDHVHIHVVPYVEPIWTSLCAGTTLDDCIHIESYEKLQDEWKKKPPVSYLLFQDVDQKIYYLPDASKLSSQFFRKCLAPHLNVDCWDWRRENYKDNIVKTIDVFREITQPDGVF